MRIAATNVEEEVRLPHRCIAGDEVVVVDHDVSIALDQRVAAAPRRGCHIGPENRDDYSESRHH